MQQMVTFEMTSAFWGTLIRLFLKDTQEVQDNFHS